MNFHNIFLMMPDSIFSQRGRILVTMLTEVMEDIMDRKHLFEKLIEGHWQLIFSNTIKTSRTVLSTVPKYL